MDYGTFYIRYGPAVIFSNIVPGLDVNFINPKYTDEPGKGYDVKATPSLNQHTEYTTKLKNSSVNNLYGLMSQIFNVIGEEAKSETEVVFITDDKGYNAVQMIISYKDHTILVEAENFTNGGIDGSIIKPISRWITDRTDGGTDVASKTFTYSELETQYNNNKSSDWAQAIDKLIQMKGITWYNYNQISTTTEKVVLPRKTVTINGTSYNSNDTYQVDQIIKEQLKDYGYNDASEKGGPNSVYSGANNQYYYTDGGESKVTTYYYCWKTADNLERRLYYTEVYDTSGKIVSLAYEVKDITYSTSEVSTETGETKYSAAFELQGTVATWYKALRAIALVGLLSVLVYVGIRILISSTGQEKAKYKKMIIDWVTAICILFVLQYIMVFTLEITQKITDVLSVSAIGENGEDILMSNLRTSLGVNTNFSLVFPELLMYLVLVIYTVMFTIQYLKRLLYMAFFTMIAPLIALTYPLDKIKDGQAQAFSTWIREYIFNALLQPMHLLLYTIFVSSAMDFVGSNPLYAIVAVGFLLPAEKFFRKMFGFDKASSSNQLGAAAGGALIMNAINKMGHSSGKKAAGGSGGSGDSGSSSGSTPRYVSGPADASGGNDIHNANQSAFDGDGSAKPAAKAQSNGVLNGAKTLGGHYFNSANGKKIAKGLGRTARKIGVGGVGAAALGTVGLAAGIATGDPGNALKYGAAGAAAGYMGANNIGDKAAAFEKTNREIFQEGRYGTDEYNTRKSISELKGDNDFNRAFNSLSNVPDKEELIRQFHTNGITSSADIKKSVNIMSQTGATPAEIITAQRLNQEAKKYGMKRKDIEERLNKNNNIDTNTMLNLIDKL